MFGKKLSYLLSSIDVLEWCNFGKFIVPLLNNDTVSRNFSDYIISKFLQVVRHCSAGLKWQFKQNKKLLKIIDKRDALRGDSHQKRLQRWARVTYEVATPTE